VIRRRAVVALPRAALAALACGALACGAPDPPTLPRVQGVEPAGPAVPVALPAVSVTFTAPVASAGLVDGRRLVLVPEALATAARKSVESEAGAADLAGAAPGRVALEGGGTRAVLHLSARLHARTSYLLLVSSRLRAADGHAVLDAAGHRGPTEVRFEAGAEEGPAGRAVLTAMRVDADTPEAGGEYVEIANLGPGALDLFGLRLAKRTPTGGVSSCALGDGVVPPSSAGLVVGGAYDGRYPVPAAEPVVTCGATALLGGLANDHPPALELSDGLGELLTTLGAAGVPRCAVVVRLDLEGPDALSNLGCGEAGAAP
jgi:hypothetical protein